MSNTRFVFVVVGILYGEGDTILKVFEDEAAAEAYMEEKEKNSRYDSVFMETIEYVARD